MSLTVFSRMSLWISISIFSRMAKSIAIFSRMALSILITIFSKSVDIYRDSIWLIHISNTPSGEGGGRGVELYGGPRSNSKSRAPCLWHFVVWSTILYIVYCYSVLHLNLAQCTGNFEQAKKKNQWASMFEELWTLLAPTGVPYVTMHWYWSAAVTFCFFIQPFSHSMQCRKRPLALRIYITV